jgi:alkylhydroperoxidase family enzyme
LERDDLDPDDRIYFDRIASERSRDPSDRRLAVPDIYRILLRSPDLASRVAATPMAIRAGTTVPQDVQEIVVLTVSREARAGTQWAIHVQRARDAGVREAVINGINDGDHGSMNDREQLLVTFATDVYHQRADDHVVAQIADTFGERALVELTVLVAFTTMMIQIVKTFDAHAPVDVDVPLRP